MLEQPFSKAPILLRGDAHDPPQLGRGQRVEEMDAPQELEVHPMMVSKCGVRRQPRQKRYNGWAFAEVNDALPEMPQR